MITSQPSDQYLLRARNPPGSSLELIIELIGPHSCPTYLSVRKRNIKKKILILLYSSRPRQEEYLTGGILFINFSQTWLIKLNILWQNSLTVLVLAALEQRWAGWHHQKQQGEAKGARAPCIPPPPWWHPVLSLTVVISGVSVLQSRLLALDWTTVWVRPLTPPVLSLRPGALTLDIRHHTALHQASQYIIIS